MQDMRVKTTVELYEPTDAWWQLNCLQLKQYEEMQYIKSHTFVDLLRRRHPPSPLQFKHFKYVFLVLCSNKPADKWVKITQTYAVWNRIITQ